MPLVLSTQDWHELWDADPLKDLTIKYPDAFEKIHSWRCSLDQGCRRDLQLRDLWLTIEEYQHQHDVIFHSELASCETVSCFFISGTIINCHQGLTAENLESPGHHYIEYIQAGREADHLFAGDRVVRISFSLNLKTLNQFGETIELPRELQPLANDAAPNSFYRQGKTTADMQVVLHQILNCPYKGSLKQMYLEGKVLELAALQFSQFTEQDRFISPSLVFKPDDIERLHQAKTILMQQFEQPPSLTALARQVGLNDCKLKQGFRQLFGATVFGYLRDYRLEQARLLLIQDRLNVQQVAHTVGYAQSGYFAKAFKQKFGVSPKTYQLSSARSS
ncbi:MAG: helix-turn-helix transcriptional regulator [Leptolyngbyaceae cyanobacterium SL_5_9]|nr:helix-turn-helix transcriptional regulator [Leptolyngbyaceae cyanobacterium SL_5_9]NJO73393.1 helix-turn-helix transcriptional regulator [Leptolyngbyaceae cyanobacterium RM1_406_9]